MLLSQRRSRGRDSAADDALAGTGLEDRVNAPGLCTSIVAQDPHGVDRLLLHTHPTSQSRCSCLPACLPACMRVWCSATSHALLTCSQLEGNSRKNIIVTAYNHPKKCGLKFVEVSVCFISACMLFFDSARVHTVLIV